MDFNADVSAEVGKIRGRSNTWPRKQNDIQANDSQETLKIKRDSPKSLKIPGRKNIWGQFSYADLITQAIASAPEQRMTLSEIYSWMVVNVPCLKEENAASWKNSVRHNLSLHNKFVKVTNESIGKSSWWTVNYDAKPIKFGRRRCSSMESGKLESMRRSRKKLVSTAKLTLPSHLDCPNQATISMEIRHEGLPELGIDLRYQQEGPQFHPAYRQRAQSTGFNNYNQNLVNCPNVLPGYHCSTAFRSGGFFQPEVSQNFDNSQQINTFAGQQHQGDDYYQHFGRSRSYAIGNLKKANLKKQFIPNQQNPNFNCNQMLNYHFEGFQEGYNSNFVENYSEGSLQKLPPETQECNQLNQTFLNGYVEEENLGKKTNDNGVGLHMSQQHSSILDCNIADVIKRELEIDGTLDFV